MSKDIVSKLHLLSGSIGATDVAVIANVPLGARFMEASEMIKPLVCIRLWRHNRNTEYWSTSTLYSDE